MRPPDSPCATRALRVVLGSFAALAVLFTGTFPPFAFANPNELSRYQTIVAAVERGTFEISEELRRFGGHEDISVSDGRTYSNKAPGLALAGIPVYRILRLVLPAPDGGAAPIFSVVRFFTVSAVTLLALARFGRRIRERAEAAAPLVVYGVAFGTPLLFYARSFFSHAWTAALLFLAWDRILAAEERAASRPVTWAYVAAGFFGGVAAISEYPVMLVVLLLAARAAAGRAWRGLAFFLAGLSVPLLALAAYNTACFGSPWNLSSAREGLPEYQKLSAGGLFGFQAPSPRVALSYLLHPARGVLLFSPFLLWAFAGFVRWWRSRERRADFFLCLGSTLLFFVTMSGYPNWHGGWSLGSRYLLPVLFFAAFPIVRALDSPGSRGAFLAAVVFSAASHFLLTATFPYFPDWLRFPVANGSTWFLAHGWFAHSLFGLSTAAGVAALAVAAGAFTVPLVLSVRVAAPITPRPVVCALLGVAPLAFLLLRPPEISYQARLWRAGVLGRYSGRDPARQELRSEALAAATPEEKQLAVRAWRIFGPPTP